ncbi:DUF6082 family protein [Nonomuraea maritima]|uniref:DUF6082 family protein n=1 Tax=Nonomuraea maritima TaxID=683260 RepID=UPI00371619AE
MKKWPSRAAVATLTLVVLVCTGAALLLSPIVLGDVADLVPASRWRLLSEVGQAYGAAATLISTAALVGVVASVAMQARSARIAATQAMRTTHLELARLIIEDPTLSQAAGEGWTGASDDLPIRLHFLINQWMVHHRSAFELGMVEAHVVRAGARNVFKGEAGRRFWTEARTYFQSEATSRRKCAFYHLVNDEFIKAETTAANPIIHPQSNERPKQAVAVACGVIVFGLGFFLGRRTRMTLLTNGVSVL